MESAITPPAPAGNPMLKSWVGGILPAMAPHAPTFPPLTPCAPRGPARHPSPAAEGRSALDPVEHCLELPFWVLPGGGNREAPARRGKSAAHQ